MVDDHSKEWKVTFAGGQSRFADEATRSQSSSYKQKQVEKVVDDDDDWFEDRFDSTSTRVKEETKLDVAADTTVVADAEPKEENTSSASSMSRDELASLTVPSLKEKLREAGKPVSGKKAELVDRLLA